MLAVGCAEGCRFGGQVSPFDRHLLAELNATRVDGARPDAPSDEPIEAWQLPDVAAEARAVAELAGTSDRLLVLTADSPTEERVRAALFRNGIAVADDGASSLTGLAWVGLARDDVAEHGGRLDEARVNHIRCLEGTPKASTRYIDTGWAIAAWERAELPPGSTSPR